MISSEDILDWRDWWKSQSADAANILKDKDEFVRLCQLLPIVPDHDPTMYVPEEKEARQLLPIVPDHTIPPMFVSEEEEARLFLWWIAVQKAFDGDPERFIRMLKLPDDVREMFGTLQLRRSGPGNPNTPRSPPEVKTRLHFMKKEYKRYRKDHKLKREYAILVVTARWAIGWDRSKNKPWEQQTKPPDYRPTPHELEKETG